MGLRREGRDLRFALGVRIDDFCWVWRCLPLVVVTNYRFIQMITTQYRIASKWRKKKKTRKKRKVQMKKRVFFKLEGFFNISPLHLWYFDISSLIHCNLMLVLQIIYMLTLVPPSNTLPKLFNLIMDV